MSHARHIRLISYVSPYISGQSGTANRRGLIRIELCCHSPCPGRSVTVLSDGLQVSVDRLCQLFVSTI
jgi:hypothetical protein